MVLGDGIRRNIATVSKEERDLFIDAVKQLNRIQYNLTSSKTDFPAGHVSYWFKQDDIHQSSHVHNCPGFISWHREMCNRYESLLRTIHSELSLHYWDWNCDPSAISDGQGGVVNLFDADFMGNADDTVNEGSMAAIPPIFSIDKPGPNDTSTWRYPSNFNPADPPKTLTRGKSAGRPAVGGPRWPKDEDILNANTSEQFRALIERAHNQAHGYIGGNLGNPHISFRDPFVFLLHSNVDRLWAIWQLQPGHVERLDPNQVYNTESNSTGDVEIGRPFWGILSPLEPWAGFTAQTTATGIIKNLLPIRPWFAPENKEHMTGNYKTALDVSVVTLPSYDTAPHSGSPHGYQY
ncbi:uncharacterized protein TRUGW13939_03677 [Talaromyces rugulosus]|uniref:Tyrosinase copper-binding domain-containing protein n=1 Tax=Talaromyces rugulosus TaxID=121627 RepID=A0A7H8QRN6_TALRU|nr:uncharacterized protein TRUGW13939_03677 [Talaromyces rugulosus]QKX56572.1 hypothetical protein TRUGW13939_03677 [Talaromyces rugulosus]